MLKQAELLKLTTAGSVDDGKSTLIGRLLYDCQSIFEDQLASVAKVSKKRGLKEVDLSLLLDGLSAEREQGITIDVAYRYFATANRKFIVADTPGHEQYTRNMVTGASTANLALILCDARKGLIAQSKRHLFIATLLGIPHILVVVNKMDLMEYQEEVFEQIKEDFVNFAAKMDVSDLQFIPISALQGDMVVERGEKMHWYQGQTLLSYLENLQVASDRNLIDFRFPVQYVIRPHQDFRGYAGQVAGGVIRKGEKIRILPSGVEAKVQSILYDEKEVEMAFSPQSIVMTLDRELDVSRGDFIVKVDNLPESGNDVEAMLCWFDEKRTMELNRRYMMKLGTRTVPCFVEQMKYMLNVNSLSRDTEAVSLKLNEIGRVHVHTTEAIIYDAYKKNHNTGSFILIDEITNQTVAAGVVMDKGKKSQYAGDTNLVAKRGAVLWFTGLSGSGKSTIADKLAQRFVECGLPFERVDGDTLREMLCSDLGFAKADRDKNIDRAGYVAGLLSKHGVFALCSFISPYREKRADLRSRIDNFVEIFVNTPLDVCEKRDVKGLYKQARDGKIENFTGVSDLYEAPENPELEIKTAECSADAAVEQIMKYLIESNYLSNE